MPRPRRRDDDQDTPIPERTSWRIRVPKSLAVKIAASLIVTMLSSVAATFLTMRAQVDANRERIATMAIEHAQMAVEVAVLRGRLNDHLGPRVP